MAVSRALTHAGYELMKAAFVGSWGKRNRAVFILGVRTGFRISEILSLKVGDVVDESGRVVERIAVRRAHMKGKKTGRTVAVHPELERELKEYVAWLDGKLLNNASRPLFPDCRGNSINRREYWRIIKTTARRARIPLDGTSTHTMRKTFATWLHNGFLDRIAKGERVDPLYYTQEGLGHASPSSTVQYLKSNKEVIDAAVRAL